MSLSILASASNAREPGRENTASLGAQVILAGRLGNRISLLAVPMYVSRTNYLDADDDRGTAALGLGGQWNLTRRYALTVEWIGQLSGVEAEYQSFSMGFSILTAHHVFNLLATNTSGVHTELYAPGGDLDVRDGDFRLGFNLAVVFPL